MKKVKDKDLLVVRPKNISQKQPNLIMGEGSIDKAVKIANELSKIIKKQGLYANVKGKSYVMVEGWNTLGALMGVFPEVVKLERVETKDDKEIKYLAEVRIKTPTDQVITTAQAICSNKEASKGYNEEYAISSMAQTRATGKAFRLAFSWIMSMAGYEATPLEEMNDLNQNNDVLDLKTQEEIDKLSSLKQLNEYYEKNKGKGKEFYNYLLKRKKQLEAPKSPVSDEKKKDITEPKKTYGAVKKWISACLDREELGKCKEKIKETKPYGEKDEELLNLIDERIVDLGLIESAEEAEKSEDIKVVEIN